MDGEHLKTRGQFWRCFSKTGGHFCPPSKFVTLQVGARRGCRFSGGLEGTGASRIGARGRIEGPGGAGIAPISLSPPQKKTSPPQKKIHFEGPEKFRYAWSFLSPLFWRPVRPSSHYNYYKNTCGHFCPHILEQKHAAFFAKKSIIFPRKRWTRCNC